MNTKCLATISLFACLALTACPENPKETGGKPTPLSVVVAQPANADSIPPVMESLRAALTASATASNGAAILSLDLRILQSNGQALLVPAPADDGWQKKLFGDSPLTMMQRLKAQLSVLEARLKAGANGHAMDPKALQEAPKSLFKTNAFVVWSNGGGANPWTKGEPRPDAFVEDRAAFEAQVTARAAGRNFLVLTEALPALATAEPIKAVPAKVQPVAAKTVAKASPPPVATTPAPKADPQGEVPKPSPASHEIGAQHDPINIIFGSSFDPMQKTKVAPHMEFPAGAEPVGEPVAFDTGSASIAKEMPKLESIAAQLKAIMSRERVRVFIIAGADSTPGKEPDRNRELAARRGTACEAALIKLGVMVDRVISVGSDHAPDQTSPADLARYRQAQCFVIREKGDATAQATTTASR